MYESLCNQFKKKMLKDSWNVHSCLAIFMALYKPVSPVVPIQVQKTKLMYASWLSLNCPNNIPNQIFKKLAEIHVFFFLTKYATTMLHWLPHLGYTDSSAIQKIHQFFLLPLLAALAGVTAGTAAW